MTLAVQDNYIDARLKQLVVHTGLDIQILNHTNVSDIHLSVTIHVNSGDNIRIYLARVASR